MEVQVIISLGTVICSGISVYVGVKVALAEIRRDISFQQKQIDEYGERINRLEAGYFKG
jgi:hypothetical protein